VRNLNMVYIGVGSNMGDRLKNIEDACDRIDQIPGTKITQTSSLWETKAMYVEDQAEFYNAVCEVGQVLDILSPVLTLLGINRLGPD
jgi:2-amino-4-hydroxy-6-hydroxymethyldihydropteridine diphosphokinase / dihydropteroate synthase